MKFGVVFYVYHILINIVFGVCQSERLIDQIWVLKRALF